jgi:hypothetical protein
MSLSNEKNVERGGTFSFQLCISQLQQKSESQAPSKLRPKIERRLILGWLQVLVDTVFIARDKDESSEVKNTGN